jgi:aminoglycoside phosphotransferase (APT) family kinase protein
MSDLSRSSLLDRVVARTGARRVIDVQPVQSLWSGYGEILRVGLEGGEHASVVVKHVRPPSMEGDHAARRSHARKLRSYEVERAWYRHHAARCDDSCRVARCFAADRDDAGWLFVLEDLDAAGFPSRRRSLSDAEIDACLSWLASFHATFVHRAGETSPADLWPQGTYWHLATRQDELEAMPRGALRDAATEIDTALEAGTHRTLVHGDAKTANFCFGPASVAAVDFQYVGGGCGMKDVVYFFSCLGEARCERAAEGWLDTYFVALAALA